MTAREALAALVGAVEARDYPAPGWHGALISALAQAQAVLDRGATDIATVADPGREGVATTDRVHDLKCWPPYYEDVSDGRKSFEARFDDRGYRVGDMLRLREWLPSQARYTGRECLRVVVYRLSGSGLWGLAPGYCVLGLAPAPPDRAALRERVTHLVLGQLGPLWISLDETVDAILAIIPSAPDPEALAERVVGAITAEGWLVGDSRGRPRKWVDVVKSGELHTLIVRAITAPTEPRDG